VEEIDAAGGLDHALCRAHVERHSHYTTEARQLPARKNCCPSNAMLIFYMSLLTSLLVFLLKVTNVCLDSEWKTRKRKRCAG
jgi:hypothetical protein